MQKNQSSGLRAAGHQGRREGKPQGGCHRVKVQVVSVTHRWALPLLIMSPPPCQGMPGFRWALPSVAWKMGPFSQRCAECPHPDVTAADLSFLSLPFSKLIPEPYR